MVRNVNVSEDLTNHRPEGGRAGVPITSGRYRRWPQFPPKVVVNHCRESPALAIHQLNKRQVCTSKSYQYRAYCCCCCCCSCCCCRCCCYGCYCSCCCFVAFTINCSFQPTAPRTPRIRTGASADGGIELPLYTINNMAISIPRYTSYQLPRR